ncbi:MAG: acetyltransferase [Bacteroidota bacterium]
MKKGVILIGYSGHAYVVCDIFRSQRVEVIGYCENEEKAFNPFDLKYFGTESSAEGLSVIQQYDYFIAIGNNQIRQKIYQKLATQQLQEPTKAIHNNTTISDLAAIENGTMIAPNVTINALAKIGKGVICNTACVIEHECQIGDFVHIAPRAVLAGNVTIGKTSFIGANAVVKQGIKIGENVTVGAGSVILKDIPNDAVVVGNPGKIIKYNR